MTTQLQLINIIIIIIIIISFLFNVNKIPRTPNQENNMTLLTTMPRTMQQYYFLDNYVS